MATRGLVVTAISRLGVLDACGSLRRKITEFWVTIMMCHRGCTVRAEGSLAPLSPWEFEDHVDYPCRNYELLSLEHLSSHVRLGEPCWMRPVVTTFGDGSKDNWWVSHARHDIRPGSAREAATG